VICEATMELTALRGALVRRDHMVGRVLYFDLPHVHVEWYEEDDMLPQPGTVSLPHFSDLSIHHPQKGWVSLSEVVAVPKGLSPLAEDLRILIEEATEMDEGKYPKPWMGLLRRSKESFDAAKAGGGSGGGKAHSPFKYAGEIGPGPRGGWPRGLATHTKKDYWDCSGENYKYQCTGKNGEQKTITVKKGWKRDYNQDYKKWQSARKDVASPSRIRKRRERKAAKR